MLPITLRRSLVTIAAAAGLLAATVPAGASAAQLNSDPSAGIEYAGATHAKVAPPVAHSWRP